MYLSQDWNIYTDLLQSYFPCKNASLPTESAEDKERAALEADVLNADNIPDLIDIDDFLKGNTELSFLVV